MSGKGESIKKPKTKEEHEYIEELTDIQFTAYLIAREHLESSFDLEKSIGFKQWLDKKNKNNQKTV